MTALKAAGICTEDVDYVLCTHLHSDHVGWNTKMEDGRWIPTFPNAKYLITADDNNHFKGEAGTTYKQSVLPVIEAGQVELVTPDHELGDNIALIPTPGHTPGHVSVLIKSGNSEAIITGDAIHTATQCWHPDWHFKFDTDGETAVKSRRKLLQNASAKNRKVIGTHFALPSIGFVKENRDVFRWQGD